MVFALTLPLALRHVLRVACPSCDGWWDLDAATWADYDSDGDVDIDILLAGT